MCLKKNVVAVMCICLPIVAQSAPIQFAGNGHWYDLIPKSNLVNTWAFAKADAESKSITVDGEILFGHLATITSAAENDFIDNTLGGIGWIGGFQDPDSASASADWNWVTGEAWDYTNWEVNEPNDLGAASDDPLFKENNGENILEIYSNGRWNDFSEAAFSTHYVIEYEAIATVPVPAAVWLFGSGLLGLVGVARRKKA